jgi:hypothetical protein
MQTIYIVPEAFAASFRDERTVIRVDEADSCARWLVGAAPDNVAAIQTTALPDPDDVLFADQPPDRPLALDLLMCYPERDFPLLYALARLRERHPVRVSLELGEGFEKAFTLAAALGLHVKILVRQPSEELVGALERALDQYLRDPSVVEPVEFFNSVLLFYALDQPVTLWDVQEEGGPWQSVSADGRVTPPAPYRGPGDPAVGEPNAECSICPFEPVCAGYFKHPDPGYDCSPIRRVFGSIAAAAGELQRDLEACPAPVEPS